MNGLETTNALPLSACPPLALDEFMKQSGLSAVTLWRYREKGWLSTINICGRLYVTREEIANFNARASAGEFAKVTPHPSGKRTGRAPVVTPSEGLQ